MKVLFSYMGCYVDPKQKSCAQAYDSSVYPGQKFMRCVNQVYKIPDSEHAKDTALGTQPNAGGHLSTPPSAFLMLAASTMAALVGAIQLFRGPGRPSR